MPTQFWDRHTHDTALSAMWGLACPNQVHLMLVFFSHAFSGLPRSGGLGWGRVQLQPLLLSEDHSVALGSEILLTVHPTTVAQVANT